LSSKTQNEIFESRKAEVERVQKKALANIFEKPSETMKIKDVKNSILSEIQKTKYTSEIVEAALGIKLGSKLYSFAKSIDLDHPLLNTLFKGQLLNGEFSKDCCALLDLAKYAVETKSRAATRIKKILPKNSLHRDIEKYVDDPSVNQLHVRLVADQAERDKIRATKKAQTINVNLIEKRGVEIWRNEHPTFFNYSRNVNMYEEELKEVQKEYDHFMSLRCEDLAQQVKEEMDKLKNQNQEKYFGFNKISMTNAAIVLAKVHGYKITHDTKSNGRMCNQKIIASRDLFGDCSNFFFNSVGENTDYTWFGFEPRNYTIMEFREFNNIPQSMEKLIAHLEKFPEINGKPLFDHYRIMIPSVRYPSTSSSQCSYIDNDKNQVDGPLDKVRKELDMILFEKGFYSPVLLGEKDADSYFISYFV